MRNVSPTLVPPPDTTGPSSVPVVEKKVGPGPDGAFSGAASIEEVLYQKDSPASAPPSSWEEMMEILRWVPCFSDAEPSSTKISDLFYLTKQISVNLGGGESLVFVST